MRPGIFILEKKGHQYMSFFRKFMLYAGKKSNTVHLLLSKGTCA